MDRSERDRAAMAQAGLTAVPFKRITPADVAGCEGVTQLNGRTFGLCHRCERYGHNGRVHVLPQLVWRANGVADCAHFRQLLSDEQVAAMDETGGIHATHCAPVQGGEKALPVGPATAGCTESQRHSGVVSTRAGEGGTC